jgi:hypothetical protein
MWRAPIFHYQPYTVVCKAVVKNWGMSQFKFIYNFIRNFIYNLFTNSGISAEMHKICFNC